MTNDIFMRYVMAIHIDSTFLAESSRAIKTKELFTSQDQSIFINTSIEKNSIESNIIMKNNDPQLVHRKVAVLGFRAVGKTSLSNSFVNGTFDETYDPTIENTHHKIIRFRKVNFATDIVDTAGMDEYSRLSRSASVGVDGYVLVYSIISRQSFERIQHINENLLSALGDDISIPRVLVGSICDLNHERQVSYRVSGI